jgi:hypothetical protein
MAGKSANSFGAKNWAPNSPATRYNVSGKNREFYTFENAPGLGVYASGGTIIDGGDGYIYHIFTGDGTFTVNRPSAAIDSVDYMIVAGGGAITQGVAPQSGGGGGGGMLFGTIPVGTLSYPISVGAGGPSVVNSPVTTGTQRNGSPTSAFGLTATGGGSGGNFPPGTDGRPGGSGGGGAFPGGSGGAGNTPGTIPRQGYNGAVPNGASSGGGGAGGAGVSGGPSITQVGAGGPGRIDPNFPASIVGLAIPAPVFPNWNPLISTGGYAAGGCGTLPSPGGVPGPFSRTTPQNSGYGGQGGGANAGGSGIVCIRYKKTAAYQRATGGTIEPNTHPEHPGVWRHIFTSPGDFTITDPTLQWVDYLAVGGGGGGGQSDPGAFQGSGGGAGGFVSSIHTSTTTPTSIPEAYPWNPGYSVEVGKQMPVGVGTYPVVIGAGGTANTAGNDTTIGSGPLQIIAYGGGGGRPASGNGNPGASGGGAAKAAPSTTSFTGGTATPTPLIQGNNGSPSPNTPGLAFGGGGGGAGGAAGPGGSTGAAGWYSVISPSAYGTPGPLTPNPQYRYFAGGGSGGVTSGPPAGGGGGGWPPPGNSTPANGSPGTTNTGGGGGGAALTGTAGDGGPGIVIIQYPE